jgi:hypothetical protein
MEKMVGSIGEKKNIVLYRLFLLSLFFALFPHPRRPTIAFVWFKMSRQSTLDKWALHEQDKTVAAKTLLARHGMPGMGMPTLDEATPPASTHVSRGNGVPRVRVGNRNLAMHTELVEMTDSTDLYRAQQFVQLRQRLETDGFLFVRGVIPTPIVEAARRKMLGHLHAKGAIREHTPWEQGLIEYKTRWDAKQKGSAKAAAASAAATSTSTTSMPTPQGKMISGWTVDAESGGLVNAPEKDDDAATQGWHGIGNSAELVAVYNGPSLHAFFLQLFAHEPSFQAHPTRNRDGHMPFVMLPNCTWLRAKGPGEVTAEHIDYYYFSKHSSIFGDHFVPPHGTTEHLDEATREQQETCQICHSNARPESTLICDLCGRGFHMDCLRPKVAVAPTTIPGTDQEQEWHCYTCQNSPLPYWTTWVALGNISGLDGRLALIPGSHRLEGVEAPTHDGLLPRGYTKSFESRAVWQTPSTIAMGDIIVFNIKLVHGATSNAGERFRLSLDTRVTVGGRGASAPL